MQIVFNFLSQKKYFVVFGIYLLIVCFMSMGFSGPAITLSKKVNNKSLIKNEKKVTYSLIVLVNDCGTGATISTVALFGSDGYPFHFVDKTINLGSHQSYTITNDIFGVESFTSGSFIQANLGPWGPACIIQIFCGQNPTYYDNPVVSSQTISPAANSQFNFTATWPQIAEDWYYTFIVIEPQA